MKQIELEYTDEVSLDLLESILKQRFPDKQITRQNWGFSPPFLRLKMNFWLQETVYVTQNTMEHKTKVIVNENCTMAGWFFLGWPLCWMFMKLHRKEVMHVIRDELQERIHVVFLN